jgi:hypothetical protein
MKDLKIKDLMNVAVFGEVTIFSHPEGPGLYPVDEYITLYEGELRHVPSRLYEKKVFSLAATDAHHIEIMVII